MPETAVAPLAKEGQEGQSNGTQNGSENGNGQPQQPQLTDENVFGWLKDKGINIDNLDTLKQKVEYTPPPPPPTDEQKTKAEKDRELKLVNLYLAKGGTPETYAYLKTLVQADPKEIGFQKELDALMKDGFSKEKAEEIARQMHLQISDEEIEATEDEKDRDALKKAKAYGLKKQSNRGLYLQQQAKSFFDSLQSELQELETEKQNMELHSVKVTEAIKNFPKKQTLEMGEIDGQTIPHIDFEVSDQALTEAETILKDASHFEKQLYNKDGSVNIDFLLPHFVRSISFPDAVKRGYLIGGDRQVEHIKATFGSTVPDLGGSKKPDGKGQIISSGKPEMMDGRPATK